MPHGRSGKWVQWAMMVTSITLSSISHHDSSQFSARPPHQEAKRVSCILAYNLHSIPVSSRTKNRSLKNGPWVPKQEAENGARQASNGSKIQL